MNGIKTMLLMVTLTLMLIAIGKFIRECKCFPIKFKITSKEGESFEKTFYFFKNDAGTVEVSEYQFSLIK